TAQAMLIFPCRSEAKFRRKWESPTVYFLQSNNYPNIKREVSGMSTMQVWCCSIHFPPYFLKNAELFVTNNFSTMLPESGPRNCCFPCPPARRKLLNLIWC